VTKTKLATSFSEVGFTLIKLRRGKSSKKPVHLGWQDSDYTFPEDVPELLEGWAGNYGVVLGPEDLCIDCDPRNYQDGDNPIKRLVQDANIDLLDYGCFVKTGGEPRGLHIYLTIPPGLKIKEMRPEYKGLEFKTQGRYLVGPGCIHPETEKKYIFSGQGQSVSRIGQAPQALLDIIARPVITTENLDDDKLDLQEVTDNDDQVLKRYEQFLYVTDPAVEGDAGDLKTFTVACRGRDMGLSKEKTLELMQAHYNDRCLPPWGARELEEKVRNAFAYASGKKGQGLASTDFQALDRPNVLPWIRGPKGVLLSKKINAECFLNSNEYGLRGVLGWCEMARCVRYIRPLPWHRKNQHLENKYGDEWGDADSVDFSQWLSQKGLELSTKVVNEVVESMARKNPLNPLTHWLDNLEWDGVPRLETWLIRHAGARDDTYVRAISRICLIQAVARAKSPGCKVDESLILEGKQGAGKSKLVELLGGDWYGYMNNVDVGSKDTYYQMHGQWIMELVEMTPTRKTDADELKGFLTTRIDKYRRVYGTKLEKFRRTCIFIGTVNPNDIGYFVDQTGNRRFHPVHVSNIDLAALALIRDQLFAEAMDCYMRGELTYINDAEVLKLAEKEQKQRLSADPWFPLVEEYILANKPHTVKIMDIWIYVLKGTESNLGHPNQRRIGACLRDMDYENKPIYINGKAKRCWVNDAYRKSKNDKR